MREWRFVKGRLQAVTVASPAYVREHGLPSSPDELSQHACIAYRHPSTGKLEPMTFRVGGRDVAVTPRARLVVKRRLVRLLERFTATPWSLYLCYAGAKRLPHRVRAFVEFARAELAREKRVLTPPSRGGGA